MRFTRSIFGISLAGLLAFGSYSVCFANEEINPARAKFNYQMLCQGCHSIDGVGYKSVPQLKGEMHQFMALQQGREYLVRVPGAANSVLDDNELAELLNWMLAEFSDPQVKKTWSPYMAEEVGEYRKSPLFETIKYRQSLLERLNLNPVN